MGLLNVVRDFSTGIRSGKATLILAQYYGLLVDFELSERIKYLGRHGVYEAHDLAVYSLTDHLRSLDNDVHDAGVRKGVAYVIHRAKIASATGLISHRSLLQDLFDVARLKYFFDAETETFIWRLTEEEHHGIL